MPIPDQSHADGLYPSFGMRKPFISEIVPPSAESKPGWERRCTQFGQTAVIWEGLSYLQDGLGFPTRFQDWRGSNARQRFFENGDRQWAVLAMTTLHVRDGDFQLLDM